LLTDVLDVDIAPIEGMQGEDGNTGAPRLAIIPQGFSQSPTGEQR